MCFRPRSRGRDVIFRPRTRGRDVLFRPRARGLDVTDGSDHARFACDRGGMRWRIFRADERVRIGQHVLGFVLRRPRRKRRRFDHVVRRDAERRRHDRIRRHRQRRRRRMRRHVLGRHAQRRRLQQQRHHDVPVERRLRERRVRARVSGGERHEEQRRLRLLRSARDRLRDRDVLRGVRREHVGLARHAHRVVGRAEFHKPSRASSTSRKARGRASRIRR